MFEYLGHKIFVMKKILFISLLGIISLLVRSQELSGTTIGFSFGPSFLSQAPYDYSLDPGSNNLLIQKLSTRSLVISSVITIKFGKVSFQEHGDGKDRKMTFVKTYEDERNSDNTRKVVNKAIEKKKAKFEDRLAFNLGINLAEVSSDNLSFNKNIDGGVGFGYFLTPSMQFAAFYDIIKIRQMRHHIINNYDGKPIPNGTEFYNALDIADNKLFYNKTFTGFSLKIVVALNPKKENNSQ